MKKIIAAALLICAMLVFVSCGEERSVRTVEINEAGELIIIFSDGTVSNAGFVKGDTGDAGENGRDGVDGTDGRDGRDGVDGEKGEQGLVGADGLSGRSVKRIYADKEGDLVVTYSDGETDRVDMSGAVYLFGGYLNDEKGLSWALYNGGFLYISGEGETRDYEEGEAPWTVLLPLIKAVYIDNNASITLDGELMSGISPDIIFYSNELTTMWVDMAVEAPIFATAEGAAENSGAEAVTYLPLGSEMSVVELCDTYAKIVYEGEYAYVALKYVRADNGSVVYEDVDFNLQVSGSSGATLRYFPDAMSDNKYGGGSLPYGTVIKCTGVSVNRNWYRVSYEGKTLYVYNSVVTKIS